MYKFKKGDLVEAIQATLVCDHLFHLGDLFIVLKHNPEKKAIWVYNQRTGNKHWITNQYVQKR